MSIRRLAQVEDAPLPKYIESQNIFESSLSQDVSKVDLSLSSVRTSEEVQLMRLRPTANTIALQKNSINDHEVMASLCAVVRHLFEQKITPTLEIGVRTGAPSWITHICRVLGDPQQHRNIRYFLSMMIDNCRQYFRHYAPVMTEAILRVLTSDCYRGTIDAFVIYLVVTLLEWNSVYTIHKEDEIDLASDLLSNLMQAAWCERKPVFKKNLDLIKCLMEIWGKLIHLPRQFLFDSMRRTRNPDSRDNMCGIQLNGIVLANDLAPWTDTTQPVYVQTLLDAMQNNYSGVYQPAAQVLGMALAKCIPEQDRTPKQIEQLDHVHRKLDKLRTVNEKVFRECLFGIHKYFAPIIDQFLTHITSYITPSTGAIKRTYLEMFLSRIHTYETNIFRELVTIRIKELLRHKDYQLLALHIINKILPTMTTEDITTILGDICEFAKSKSTECRDLMYEMLIYIHKHKRDGLELTTTPMLLNGLIDPEASIQGTLYKFWSGEANLPMNIGERLQMLFKNAYHPDAEKRFLNYCVQFLLQPSIEGPEALQSILIRSNSGDHKLHEYHIETNWKTQSSVMRMPMFMESQQKRIISGEIYP